MPWNGLPDLKADSFGLGWDCHSHQAWQTGHFTPIPMASFLLHVNGRDHSVTDVAADTPLLWILREQLALTGTKYGCGMEMCGSCTVHVDGRAVRACNLEVAQAVGKRIVTIEGLAGKDGGLHPLQEAWLEHDVAQCGFCQPGQLMQAAALLAANPNPSDDEICRAMEGNLCRCGTQTRILAAIHSAATKLGTKGGAA